MQDVVNVAVIPARAGSRGLPNKHLRLLNGKPLIAHTVLAALGAGSIDRVIVSTNDPAIARASRRAGAEVPFLRPDALAHDETPTAPVVEHAVAWLEATGTPVDLVVTLQPTSPLRDPAEIDAAVALLADPTVQSSVSVARLGYPISVVGSLADGGFRAASASSGDVRRQVAAPAVRITGGVYVTRRSLLASGRLLDERPAALEVDSELAVDIDTAGDLRLARRVSRRPVAP